MDEEAALSMEEVKQWDPSRGRFPHCVVWTPLPVVSWLSPLIGHVGICRADGVIVDFAGPFFVNVDNFAFGSPVKYVQLDPDECCFASILSNHSCSDGFQHSQLGSVNSWDEALRSCMHRYQHKSYNFFTCNCHSFVATCLNRVAYRGSVTWNMIKIMALVHSKGRWVSKLAICRSFAPFALVMSLGILVVGWTFVLGWAIFSMLFVAWFIVATYCIHGIVEDC